jgi:hypothetical protein
MKLFIPGCLLMLLMQACFTEDEPVKPFPGRITTIQDSVQTFQTWFDLESGQTVAVNPVNVWQLGFECGTDGWHIICNSGAHWFLYNTGETGMNLSFHFPEALQGLYDVQSLWPQGTAAGDWSIAEGMTRRYTGNVYLLGRLINGTFQQIKKVVFDEVTDSSYRFIYQDAVQSDSVTIRKKSGFNFVYYSFQANNQVQPEPGRDDYDLVFTAYYDLATLFGQTIPYHVGGALLNVWNTQVAVDSITNYKDITLDRIVGMDLTGERDIPGYRWKNVTVDITGGGSATYEVKTGYNYVVKTAQGNYFKLRFLSYTLDGRSGFPRFEFSRLE